VEPKTYTGWKAALLAIALTFAVFAVVNLLARHYAPRHHPSPSPMVVTPTRPSNPTT
jgi:hypothetical protein